MRAALLWGFLHAVTSIGSAAEGVPYPQAIVGSSVIALPLYAAVLIVMRVELWRRSELVFLANLGCSFRRVAAFIALVCGTLEVALRLTVG